MQANNMPGDLRSAEGVARRGDAYQRLADAGVEAVRMDIAWSQVEPLGAKGIMDFAERDREVDLARAAGLEVLGILAYGHPDYSSAGRSAQQTPARDGAPPFGVGSAYYYPPDDPADFGAYARKTAEHFRGRVFAWEVWNEQNQGWRFFAPHEDPVRYVGLLKAASEAVRAADPAALVVFGGVFYPEVPPAAPGEGGADFLQRCFDADPAMAERIDAIAYHPYAYPFTSPDLDVPVRGSVYSAAEVMRGVMERNGAGGLGLWITEFGWHSSPSGYGVSEAKQAQYMVRTYARSMAQGVGLSAWYDYGDYDDPSGANQEAHFGLFRADGRTPKPAFSALRTMNSLLGGLRFEADLRSPLEMPEGDSLRGGSGWAFRFRTPGRTRRRGRARRVTVLWYAPESAASDQGALPAATGVLSVELPVRRARVSVVSMGGEARDLAAEGGRVRLEVGPEPLYVVERRGGAVR